MRTLNLSRKEARRLERAAAKQEAKGSMVENRGFGSRLADALIIVFLVLVIFVSVIPLWHVVMASFSKGEAMLAHSGVTLLPEGGFNLGGYQLIFRDTSLLRGYLNTLIYVVAGTALGIVINVVGGYVLSRDTKWKTFMVFFFVITTMFNGGMIPTYMVIRNLGMTGTRWALIIPGATNAMFLLMMMNTFRSIDKSYEEAATLDGAGHFSMMFRVLRPHWQGMLIVTAIQTAIMKWNSWFEASIYVPTQKDKWPLQLWVKQLTANTTDFLKSSNPDYNQYIIQFAVIVIATAPILIALPFFISRLEKGIALGGVKG